MFAYFRTSLGMGELAKRTVRETLADNGLGLAAQLAYYFFFALFPSLLFLTALAGTLATPELISGLADKMSGAVPPDVIAIVRQQLVSLSEGPRGGIMTFGAVVALWSSSAAMAALGDALNLAYDRTDQRSWLRARVTAILLTLGVAIFIVVSIALVIAGPQLASSLASRFGLGAAFEWTWEIVQWPIVFTLVVLAFGFVYYFAPDLEQDWVFLTPGSVLATALWLIGSLGFRFYVVNFGSYNQTYGAIGGVMVLLLWLYISALVVIAGAEMNAEIEHASPHGRVAGSEPGGRKTVGSRAEREQAGAARARGARQPGAAPRPGWSPGTASVRAGVLIGGALAVLFGHHGQS
ncbi:MAG: YihY/virulence factor BrkB family protein [Acidobacteria bacterium]|nr:YihY/virulence factor BrkB family protein [Acidobacteriota bacterium]